MAIIITNKCHTCGYYFDGSAISTCPRCAQGFSGAIDEHFSSGESGELGKGIQSNNLRIVAAVVAMIAVGAVISSTQNSNSNSYSNDSSVTDSNESVDEVSYWMPDGFVAFDMNADIAQDTNFEAGNCVNSNYSSEKGYCWQFQIATKSDCRLVSATLDLSNYGASIGQATGEVYDTYSGIPTVLEIDTYDNPDVDDSTSGSISEIICSP